jgi:hypothetical protein
MEEKINAAADGDAGLAVFEEESRKSVSVEGHDDGTCHVMVSGSNANGAELGCIVGIFVESNKAVSAEEEGGNGLGDDVIGEDEMVDDASTGLGIWMGHVSVTLWDWGVQGIRLQDVAEVGKGATGSSWFEF